MRPQDICNLRSCDLDTSGEIWLYRPHEHKTAYRGHKLAKYIREKGQAVLMPYLLEKEDDPEAFVFSPQDTMRDVAIELRRNRKTFNKQGKVQPSQSNRKTKNPKKQPGLKYTTASYNRAITTACKKAGVPRFTANQIRHSAAVDARKNGVPLEKIQVLMGHKHADTTQIYAKVDVEHGIAIAREIG